MRISGGGHRRLAGQAKAHFEFRPVLVRTKQPQIAAVEARELAREVQAKAVARNIFSDRSRDESARRCVRAPGLGWSGRCCRS